MAQQNRVTLKTYFETGDTPTEAQFIDLIDSVVNINEDGVSSYTFGNGLTESGGAVKLGGTTTSDVNFSPASGDASFNIGYSADYETIEMTGNSIWLNADAVRVKAISPLTFGGVKYHADYSLNFSDSSLVNKKWVVDNFSAIGSSDFPTGLTVDSNSTYAQANGIAFGDGDTSIYEASDDSLRIRIGLIGLATIDAVGIRLSNTGTPALLNLAASNTQPSIAPFYTDSNTGIGRNGDDQLSLIAGGVEGARVEANKITIAPNGSIGTATGYFFGDGDTSFYENADDTIAVRLGGATKMYFTTDTTNGTIEFGTSGYVRPRSSTGVRNLTVSGGVNTAGDGGSLILNPGTGSAAQGDIFMDTTDVMPTGTGSNDYEYLMRRKSDGKLFLDSDDPSDIRLKDITGNISNSVEELSKLSTIKYKWNDLALNEVFSNESNPEMIGLVAQEVKEIYPQVVGEFKGNDGNNYMNIDYAKLVPVLINAIAELKQEINTLKQTK